MTGTQAGPTETGGSGHYISFSIENNGIEDLIVDQFSFGVGSNRQTNAWLYTSIVIRATETALTADATSESSDVGVGGWDNPLVQISTGSPAHSWAKPVYSEINLTLAATQTAEFRIYLANTDSQNMWHFNNFEVIAIPEPGTLVLVGIALGSLLLFRRRR